MRFNKTRLHKARTPKFNKYGSPFLFADDELLDFFFEPAAWTGEPQNMEPGKCDDLRWFPLDALPDNTIPYIHEAIRCYREGVGYSEWGW